MENMDDRLKQIESTPNVSRTNGSGDAIPSTSSSFANIVKSGMPKSAVVVKPKQKQHSKITMEQISNAVDKASVNVCSTRSVRDGGIVL